MFTSLGVLAVRRRWLLLSLTALFLTTAGVLGSGVFGELSSGGFEDPSAESTRAAEVLETQLDTGAPNLVLLVTAENGDVDAPEAAGEGLELTAAVATQPGVAEAASYWTLGQPPTLRSQDGDRALVLVRLIGDDDARDEALSAIERAYLEGSEAAPEGLTVELGGETAVFAEVGETVEGDLARAEAIALPLTLILLVVVFGSLVAAALPLAIGVVSIMGTFFALWVIAQVTDVSIFSINLTTALGLGLAIDYSLFIVSRFREELRSGVAPDAAVVRTVETAGRTVAFSAVTVAISLSALLVFPLYFLRSFAYAGITVVLIAAVVSVLSLPALLAVLGRRVDAARLWGRDRSSAGIESGGVWHRIATTVMRRPVPIATGAIVVLLLLGSPFLGVELGLPDERVLPEGADARQVSEILGREFPSDEADAFPVVALGVAAADAAGDIEAYATQLSAIEGVDRVDAVSGSYIDGNLVAPPGPATERFADPDGTWFSVVPSVEPVSPEGEELVNEIRGAPAPFEVAVGGSAAQLVDTKDAIFDRLPLAAAIIVAVTLGLLFLMFGSLLVPAKAVVLNLLSLTATFGAMVWVFQDGNLSGFLDFTATGTLDISVPILMFCIAFGLSMDYEVFLLSRIKEEYDRTGDNTASVALGLERTGRIVTAAAALLSITFIAFSTSGVTFIKLFGLGLALAVLMDASVVRATLVPAFMKLAGDANWWAPPPLRRLHDRFGLSESAPASPGVEMVDVTGAAPAPASGQNGASRHRPPSDERTPVRH